MGITAKIICALAFCYVAVVVWIYFSQQRLLYIPSRRMAATPAEIGLDYEDVRLTTALGTRVHGWWIPHPSSRFTLLFSHGNAGNISHRLPSFRIFHDLGLSVLIYDYSGYGQSEGEPSELATGHDARAAWEWLMARGVPPESIILFGRSLGGAVTAGLAGELAAEGVSPAGIILESTFTSVPDMGAYIYPWLPVRQLAKYRYDSVKALAGVLSPVLCAHSPEDEIVPFALGERLYAAYQGPKTFLELSGDHNGGYLGMGQAYPDGLERFLSSLGQGRKNLPDHSVR